MTNAGAIKKNSSNMIQKISINTIFLYIKVAISLLISLWSTRLVLAALGELDYGIFSLIGSLITILTVANSSMVVATQRFISFSRGAADIKKRIIVFNVSELIHILIALAALIGMLIFLIFFFDRSLNIPLSSFPAARKLFLLVSFSALLSIVTCPYEALISANENFGVLSLIGILESVLKLAAALLLQVYGGEKLLFWGGSLTGIVIVSFVLKRQYCHSRYHECRLSLIRRFDKKVFCDMIQFAGWSLLYGVSSIFAIQGFAWLLNLFFGATLNAARGIGNMLTGEAMLLCGTVSTVMLPIITKFANKESEHEFQKYTLGTCKYSTILLLLCSIPIIAETPQILKLWLSTIPPYTAIFCQLSIAEQLLAVSSNPLVTAINAKGDIGAFQRKISLTYLLRLPMIYLCFKYLDNPVTGYIVTLLAVLVMAVVRVYYAKEKCGIAVDAFVQMHVKQIFPVALIASLAVWLEISVISPSIGRLFLTCAVSSIAILGVTFFFGLNEREHQWLRNGVGKFLKLRRGEA